ncbi:MULTISPECIES: hypothetical protein [Thioclava]|uniref:Lipoprotein n=1 Tax=Thioclava kandeliae TaxID=3070818 RepID=A0ABV1SF56_9RHOB
MKALILVLPLMMAGCGHTPDIASRLPAIQFVPDLPSPAALMRQKAPDYTYNGQMITFTQVDPTFDDDAPAGRNYAQAQGVCTDHGFDFVEYWGVTENGQRFFCSN